MKQNDLFSLTKRNGTMDEKNKKRMRSLTQEEVVELVIWLGTNADRINGKTLPQIQRILKKEKFDEYPPKALRKCLIKFGIEIKRQPPKRKPVAIETTAIEAAVKQAQEKIEKLKTEINGMSLDRIKMLTIIADMSKVLCRSNVITGDTKQMMRCVNDEAKGLIEDVAKPIGRRCKIYSDTSGNSSKVQRVPNGLESSNGTIKIAGRLAKPDTGNSLRNSDDSEGG